MGAETGGLGESRYLPRTQRGDLVKLGYIAGNSIHLTGAAVDVTIVAPPFSQNASFDSRAAYPAVTLQARLASRTTAWTWARASTVLMR
jgi:hypothetical protein